LEQEEKFFVYILQSQKDFSFYAGQCKDPDWGMSKHFGFGKIAARSGALPEERIKAKIRRTYIGFELGTWLK